MSSYTKVLASPGVAALLASSILARVPLGMVALAIVLRISGRHGSFAGAGLVVACYVAASALVGPLLGRLADRYGRQPVLLGSAALNASGCVLLSLVPVHDATVLGAVAAFAGSSTPPVGAAVRSLWPQLVAPEDHDQLYAIDSTFQEVSFIIGPSFVALLGALGGSAAPLVGAAAVGLVGTTFLALQPSMAAVPASHGGGARRRPANGVLLLVVVAVLLVAGFAILEIAVVAFARAHGSASQSGLLLAVWCIGSMAGGATFGRRATAAGTGLLAELFVICAATFAIDAAAPGIGVLYLLLFVSGLAIAPAFSSIYGLVGRLSPPASAVESFSWLASGIQAGAAAGAAVGGVVASGAGARWTFGAAGLSLLLGGAVVASTRRLSVFDAPAGLEGSGAI